MAGLVINQWVRAPFPARGRGDGSERSGGWVATSPIPARRAAP